ncbi:hypothetical protein B7P43_G06881 [Cryptotermes secundus]|uniref:BTB domain-containing protein n=1 Tax=Cryptotermes secundus TaxID=105785 RepID=A0A2J7PN47_9NEOP|nr:zinc finger and BTB domain-containing protein 43 isoform X2 [Cryptotermes secundus]PNF17758.1 hypothetical protein B7P43_G06881 [Cryptotermes secundus]
MSTRPQHYCLKWNNYQSYVAEIFTQLLQAESMVDVTLCAEGHKIRAHRIVLSACSPYFQDILTNTEDSHPYIILSEMNSDDVKSIVEFIYRGELNVGADRFTSVLKLAEELQIRGLMEVSNHLPILVNKDGDESNPEPLSSTPALEENHNSSQCSDTLPDMPQTDSVDIFMEVSENVHEEPSTESTKLESKEHTQFEKKGEEEKKKKHRRETSKKYYSEDMLLAALEDLRAGRSLVETAAAYRIPRSTLHVKARAQGIALTITRQEHSGERVQAAIQAVADGASLQQAADLFKIPKTVLWRRVQKEIGSYAMSFRAKLKQSYGSDKKQAAVKALERGENLTKVSHQFQIPKTTLFREKARLVEAGRLPWTCLRKRDPDIGGFKQHRLSEAVAACKEGKMSQAVASVTFQVSTQIPVTYIDESDFSEASLIILTTGGSESMEEQIIVNRDAIPDESQVSKNHPAKEVSLATNGSNQNADSVT